MRILHDINIAGTDTTMFEELRRMGIDLRGYGIPKGPLHGTIPDDDPRWVDIARRLNAHKSDGHWISQRTWTEFTQEERNQAEVLFVASSEESVGESDRQRCLSMKN